jgi:enoyl-CoA hydratase/carnithine racemase
MDPQLIALSHSRHARTIALGIDEEERMMAEHQFCNVEVDDRLMIVTINRPEVMNAVHPPASRELEKIFDAFDTDPELWVGIVTGAGERSFSAGNDLKYQANGGEMNWPATGIAGLTKRDGLTKPLIAAVNGAALGGGFTIALACDLVIAADHAVFGLPEPRFGLAAVNGALARLPRQIGLKAAMGMALTGRQVTAAEGQTLGFVNEVVPGATLMACARRWAEMILQCSPLAVRASKEAILRGLEQASVSAALQAHYPHVDALTQSEDYVEGPRAFAQKRPPRWQGR